MGGCYPVEALLHSSLECLYNKTCLDLILSSIGQSLEKIDVKVLQLKPKYGMNETVQHMIDRLFVDEWNINYSHLNYSKKCHATDCSYSFIEDFHILHIITTMPDIYGCLTIVLSLLIPFIIDIMYRVYYRRTQIVVVPDVSAEN
ncbi:unnamed protein product [Adineta ricciae]|uniref:Uncharacterized protein n=1 Tax=Adineta ricciae TaxID=249248 RepID=A0A815PAZ4_ADIRI|nr:unnamed protein product [Adineta ricciae]CAF1617307.1 unnamed protein product [Adineta ricciae]